MPHPIVSGPSRYTLNVVQAGCICPKNVIETQELEYGILEVYFRGWIAGSPVLYGTDIREFWGSRMDTWSPKMDIWRCFRLFKEQIDV
jgi:hypothetical protein